jgi:hypothetical protein
MIIGPEMAPLNSQNDPAAARSIVKAKKKTFIVARLGASTPW